MIEEPGCLAGTLISRRPQRGPDDSRRRSLHTFDSLIARLFMHEESRTKACVSRVDKLTPRVTARPATDALSVKSPPRPRGERFEPGTRRVKRMCWRRVNQSGTRLAPSCHTPVRCASRR
jgi:hypothetical protein